MKLFAKKSLGQHFLNSSHALQQIISASDLKTGDLVLEIGPGTGILTKELLKTGAKVVAVEKDTRAIGLIKETFPENVQNGTLIIIEGDILDQKISATLSSVGILPFKFSIVANIPYYITGAILEKFLEYGPKPTKMVLLVQKEVADRIVANDGKESILSISVKAFGEPKMVAKVPKGAFLPPPKVDSAILSIENITGGKIDRCDSKEFFEMLRAGFSHKRKKLKKNLESVIGNQIIKKIWEKLLLDENIRAEDLTLDKWISIFSEKRKNCE